MTNGGFAFAGTTATHTRLKWWIITDYEKQTFSRYHARGNPGRGISQTYGHHAISTGQRPRRASAPHQRNCQGPARHHGRYRLAPGTLLPHGPGILAQPAIPLRPGAATGKTGRP